MTTYSTDRFLLVSMYLNFVVLLFEDVNENGCFFASDVSGGILQKDLPTIRFSFFLTRFSVFVVVGLTNTDDVCGRF